MCRIHARDHRCVVRRGFTLIELLVVVSVIVLLIALLMPALRTARATAQRAACASQLRQIGNAFMTYSSDHDKWFLRYPYEETSAMTYGGRAGRWNPGFYGAPKNGPAQRLLNPYLGVSVSAPDDTDVPICICPADNGAVAANPAWTHTYHDVGTSYAYNYFASVNSVNTLRDRRLTAAKRPDWTILVGDHTIHNYFRGSDRRQRWHDEAEPTANITFIDLHVSYVDVLPTDQTEQYTYFLDPEGTGQ